MKGRSIDADRSSARTQDNGASKAVWKICGLAASSTGPSEGKTYCSHVLVAFFRLVLRYSRARECKQGLGFSVLYASMVFCFLCYPDLPVLAFGLFPHGKS